MQCESSGAPCRPYQAEAPPPVRLRYPKAPLEDGEINVRAVLDALRGAEFDGPQLLVFGDDKNAPDRLMRDVQFLMSGPK